MGVSVSVCSEGEKVGERWKEEGASSMSAGCTRLQCNKEDTDDT